VTVRFHAAVGLEAAAGSSRHRVQVLDIAAKERSLQKLMVPSLFRVSWTARIEFVSPRLCRQRVFAGGSTCGAKSSVTQTGETRWFTPS